MPSMPPPPSPPGSPSSPTSPACFLSRGSTFVEEPQEIEKVVENGVETRSSGREVDPESLEETPTRSFRTLMRRFSSGLSEKLPEIPVHWRHGLMNEDRAPQRIDDHPMGYPRLAAFVNSDENFLLCRRYGLLHARVMLYRQDELRYLEKELLELDQEDAEVDPRSLKNRQRDDARDGQRRRNLIQRIDDKLKEYDDCVLRAKEMASLDKAPRRNYNSVYNWMYHNAPLAKAEAEFIKQDEDFVALVKTKEMGWFDGFVEDCLSMFPTKPTRFLFSTPEQRASTDDKLVYLYSKRRIDTFVRLIITILAVALLMVPVVVLFGSEESGTIKIVVILLFTLFFSAVLSIFTKAQRHEVFAATAAYCAVLVVFLSNILPGT